ncbi:tRNA threonylcarbamoyladenosine biosynthesis protein TsaB [Silvibacterium bohemicum]|uniref:tRNA threonylcarbamoyladenosine biosynthesis protein TsaB n=2 Tax=Silvibacterium bohemicum TaxID=1577686 RepID=A0A841JU24_9BACT|nr:tRNA threonylcarbamoyladenosine biosynthesis protein TsaB [Silvibacterium bohemicum]
MLLAGEVMLLAIDTCGTIGTIALARREGESVIALIQIELAGKTFAAQLVPRIRELLQEQSATLQNLEAIIVVNGPGSFTGVRIGVSAAKGLAEALQIPVIALSRLVLLAQKGETQAAALDAGRREVYFGRYANGKALESLAALEDLRETAEPIAVCEENLAQDWPAARLIAPPTAAEAIAAALPRLLIQDYDDIAALDGNYVRRTDAELFARPAGGRK